VWIQPRGDPIKSEFAPTALFLRRTAPRLSATSPLQLQQGLQTLRSLQRAHFPKKITATWPGTKGFGEKPSTTAITELEQRGRTTNPKFAEPPAALGQAYLAKGKHAQTSAKQGILGMKAIRASTPLWRWILGWERRVFGRPVPPMSYWPPQLNKGQEVTDVSRS